MKVPNTENYKVLLRVITDENKWRDIPCLWIWRIHTVNISILPKLIYGFNSIPVRIPSSYFVKIDRVILKVYRNAKKREYTK